MDLNELGQSIEHALPGAVKSQALAIGELTIVVEPSRIVEVIAHLRDVGEFRLLIDLCGVDWPQRPKRFDVVYHLLSLTRNLRMYGVGFALDRTGDIYLSGRLSLEAVTHDEVDRILGSVAVYCDESFNTILELGFASSIRREWRWRRSRGESTRNLDAFRGWLERDETEPSP